MKRTTALTLAIAALCLLGAVTIGGVSADVPENESDIEIPSNDDDEEKYTLSDLRSTGTTYPNSPDSFRVSGDQMYWMIHWPADTAFGSPGDPEDNHWRYLPEGGLVERNSIYLRTINPDGSEKMTVRIVSYETERVDNETVPVNVRERTVEVELESGWSIAEIPLPQSDTTREVSVWIDGHDNDLRWHFEHKSVATTESVAISTMGDYYRHALADFLGPLVLGTFAAGYGAKRVIEKAAIGPQWGYLKWALLIGFGAVISMWFFFSSLAEIVVSAPILVAIAMVILVGIVMIESYSTGVERSEFLRPQEVTNVTGPTGNDMVDAIPWERREEEVVRMSDGSVAVVRPGLLRFLSRIFGGAARLENAETIETKLPIKGSPIESLYFISQDAEQVLDYKPEGWKIDPPDLDIREDYVTIGLWLFAALAIAGAVSSVLSGFWAFMAVLGMAAIAVVRPEDGYARIEPATAHERRAYVSMLYMTLEMEDAKTIKEFEQRIPQLEAKAKKARMEATSGQDLTLIEEMLGEEGVSRTLGELDSELENGSGEQLSAEDKEAEAP